MGKFGVRLGEEMGILFATAEEESSFFQDECSDCQE